MRIIPVALALFHRRGPEDCLEVWTQVRTDGGLFHGLLEFPGGGIEARETPLEAAVREVQEEVGIQINADHGRKLGTYSVEHPERTIVLYVFLFPEHPGLDAKGEWLKVKSPELSSPHAGKIPPPNHRMIDDLYRSLYDGALS